MCPRCSPDQRGSISSPLSPCEIQLRGELLHSSLPWPVKFYGCLKKRTRHWRVWVNKFGTRYASAAHQQTDYNKYISVMWADIVRGDVCLHVHTRTVIPCYYHPRSEEGVLSIASLFCHCVPTIFLSLWLSYSTSVPAFLSWNWACIKGWHTHTQTQARTSTRRDT